MSPESSKRSGRWWWLAALLLLLVVVLWPSRPADRHPAVGKPAPEVDLVTLSEDRSWQPLDRLEPAVTLLHFWGTWCPPCQLEYPELAEMADRLQAQADFRFVPVSCESYPDTLENLQAETAEYFQSAGIESPAFADPRGVTRRSAAERLEQPALYYPTSILIDSEGQIAGVWEGYTPESVRQIEARARQLFRS